MAFEKGFGMSHSWMTAHRHGLLGTAAPIVLALVTATSAMAQTSTTDTSPAASISSNQAAGDAAANAAASDAGNQDIVVTGSHIVRPDLEAASPIASLTGEALKVNNAITVEQLLNANPQFVPGADAASNNPSDGVGTVDLRGLGAQRTLVLIDGKRAPSYDTKGEVDINTIPTALIKRVDILTGGASAVYGSDAIAGVVNFVLDDRFVGLRADGSSSVTTYGDGGQYDGSLTGGIKLGERGNFVISGGYSQRNAIKIADRPRNDFPTDSSDLTTFSGSPNANPTVFDLPDQSQVQVNQAGNLVPVYNLYNYSPTNYLQTPLVRYNAMALARYELTDGIEFFGRANYAHVKVNALLAPTATGGYSFDLSPENPYLTAGEREVFFEPGATLNPDGTTTVGISRRITESVGRIQNFVSRNYQVVGGLRGDIGGYKWEIFGQYGETKRHQDLLNDLAYSKLSQAIDAVPGPNGPVCRDPSGGCVPINVFSVGTIPANQLAFVMADGAVDTRTSELVTGGNISGDLRFLQSPLAAKPAAISVGVEYRRETGRSIANPEYASGDLIYYGQGQSVSGKYDTKEAYVELKMPIVQDRPFVQSLNLEGGFRYSKYSTVGSVYTYKGGGDWSPVEGVRFRGIYQRAVRAPNINELYSPLVGATGSLATDPCAGSNVPAQIAAICIAQGAPAVGNIPQPASGQVNVFVGGNPNLKAEKSDTITVGMVLDPPALRGFTASIDYYNIDIANAIDTRPISVTLDQCYNIDKDPNSAACQSIKRNTLTGGLNGDLQYGVPEVLGNVASKKTDGIDVTVGYHGGDAERFNYAVSFAGTYVRNFKEKNSAESPTIQCAGRFGAGCNLEPIPHWKHTASVALGYGAVSFVTRWRYLGVVKEDVDTDILKSKIPAFNYFDETVSVDIDRRFTFRVGAQNMFNKKSPIVGDTVGNDFNQASTFPVTYDALGRTVFAGFSAKL